MSKPTLIFVVHQPNVKYLIFPITEQIYVVIQKCKQKTYFIRHVSSTYTSAPGATESVLLTGLTYENFKYPPVHNFSLKKSNQENLDTKCRLFFNKFWIIFIILKLQFLKNIVNNFKLSFIIMKRLITVCVGSMNEVHISYIYYYVEDH